MDKTLDKEIYDSIFATDDKLTHEGHSFEQYVFNEDDFMKSAVFFGGTGTGKTYLCKDLLAQIKHKFPRVILFSPTASINNDFKNIIHDLLIIPELTEKKFIEVMNAQYDIAAKYNTVNNVKNLTEVFNTAATNTQKGIFEKINNIKQNAVRKIKESYKDNIAAQKIQELEEAINTDLINFMKYVILPVRHTLDLDDLSETGKLCVKYLDINPHTLFIFDDLMEEIKEISNKKKSEASLMLKNIFTKGRHYYITFWGLVQDDSSLLPVMRKNIKTNIFTSSEIANTYINRGTNGISKDDVKTFTVLNNMLFNGEKSHKKLFYFREKNGMARFSYYTAQNQGLYITNSGVINNFCDSLLKM